MRLACQPGTVTVSWVGDLHEYFLLELMQVICGKRAHFRRAALKSICSEKEAGYLGEDWDQMIFRLNTMFLTDVPQLLGYGWGTQQNSQHLICHLHLPSALMLWSAENHYLPCIVDNTWKLRPWWQKVYKPINWSQPQGVHGLRYMERWKKNGEGKVANTQWWPAKSQQVTNPGISSSCVNYTSLVSCQGPVLRRKSGGQQAWSLQDYPLVQGNSEMSFFPFRKFRLDRISDFKPFIQDFQASTGLITGTAATRHLSGSKPSRHACNICRQPQYV